MCVSPLHLSDVKRGRKVSPRLSPATHNVRRAAAWSETAFREVYTRYIDPVKAYVRRRVQNAYDAEDLAAQVFAQAFDRLEPKEPSSPELAFWLFTSARNAAANHARARKFVATVSIEEIPDTDSQSDPVEGAETRDAVRRLSEAIRALAPEARRALLMRFVEELPHSEIAKVLGRSESSSRVLVHRTVSHLRKQIS